MPKYTHLAPSWYEEARVASGPNYFYAPEDTDAAIAKTAEAIRELKKQNVTCAMIYGNAFRDEPGHIWSHVGDKKRIWHYRFGNADLMEEYMRCMREAVSLYKEAGLNVVLHFAPGLSWRDLHGLTYKGRDCGEFLIEPARPGYDHTPGMEDTWTICQNKPLARQSILEHAQELIDLGLDGMFIHDLNYRFNSYVCCCKYCRERFKEQTGYEIPDYPDPSFWDNWDNPGWREYCRWRQVTHGDFYEDAWNTLQKPREDFVLSFCTCECSISSEMRIWPACWEEGQRGATVAFYENFGHNWFFSWRRYAFEYAVTRAFGYAHGHPTLGLGYPCNDNERRGDWAHMLMNGMTLWHHSAPPLLKEALDWEDERKSLLKHMSPAAEVGVFYSRSTRDYFRQTAVDRYYNDVFSDEASGWYQTLIEAQIPTRIVLEDGLTKEDLDELTVLVLPNIGCMSAETASLIRDWVKNGGKLVATGETSLFDAKGNQRNDFLLGDVFGLKYLTTEGMYHLAMTVDREPLSARNGATQQEILDSTFSSPMLGGLRGRIQHREAQVLTEIVADDVKRLGSIWHRYQNEERFPGMTDRPYGDGRVVYFSGRPGYQHNVPLTVCFAPANNPVLLDGEYIDERVPEWGIIMRATVKTLLGDTQLVKLNGLPQGVIANTMERPEGGINVYLLNLSGSKCKNKDIIRVDYETFSYKDSVKTPFETMKEPFSVDIRGDWKSATLMSPDLPDDIKLDINRQDGSIHLDFKPEHLKYFSMIVLDN